jgi:hypothetical protein
MSILRELMSFRVHRFPLMTFQIGLKLIHAQRRSPRPRIPIHASDQA